MLNSFDLLLHFFLNHEGGDKNCINLSQAVISKEFVGIRNSKCPEVYFVLTLGERKKVWPSQVERVLEDNKSGGLRGLGG